MKFVSYSGEIFLFINMTISQIGIQICEFVDRDIISPEDLEKFILEVYYNELPSTYWKLCETLSIK